MGEENTCEVRSRKFDFGSIKYHSKSNLTLPTFFNSEIEILTSDFLIAPFHHSGHRHRHQYDLTHH